MSWAKVLPSRSDADGGFDNLAHLHAFAVTMGQKSSLPQSILAVSQVLTPDIACRRACGFPTPARLPERCCSEQVRGSLIATTA